MSAEAVPTEDKLLGSIESWINGCRIAFEDHNAGGTYLTDRKLLIHILRGQHHMALELTRLNAGVERVLAELTADKAKIAADATQLAADEKQAQDTINALADKLAAAVPVPPVEPAPAPQA